MPYRKEPVSRPVLADLERAASRHGTVLHVLDSHQTLTRFADLMRDAATEQLANDAYLSELMHWMRLSSEEQHRALDGVTAPSLAMGPIPARFIGMLRSRPRLRERVTRAGLARRMAGEFVKPIPSSGAVLLLARSATNAQDRIAGGQAMMAVWLAATRAGLAAQPAFSALAMPATLDATIELFGMSPGTEPIAALRVGQASGTPPRCPRLPLEAIYNIDRDAWDN
jgi:nitroreductase